MSIRSDVAGGSVRGSSTTDAASRTAVNPADEVQTGDAAEDNGCLLTARQLSQRWQIPVRTIYDWARRGVIPHYRAGRLLRFDETAVEESFRRQSFAGEIIPDAEQPGESAFSVLTA